ncbi:MAG: sigma-70 family RNA polymerase sigma factor [Planctomycetaceae bacterium]|nr:sigma-70 family RNA polymerase sigma factor [Planctomycetaceae bacterium]
MTDVDPSTRNAPDGRARFETTRWSLVLAAQGKSAGEMSRPLEALCRQYWRPLYAYVRHRGRSEHDAQDLTQAFFARLLEKDWLAAVDRKKGRFRTFLLTALKRFLANEWDYAHARKRGGGEAVLPLDGIESLSLADLSVPTAEALFERRWALTVFESALRRLRADYEAAGRLAHYELLKPQLTAERGAIDYDSLAAALNMEPASARSAVHRLRKRFREAFQDEVAETVADPADVEDEVLALVAALSSN